MTTNVSFMPSPAYQGSNGSGHARPEPPPLPHIEDVLAIPRDVDANQSIKRLLELAETALRRSEIYCQLNKPAPALSEYIRASVVAVQVISNHRDFYVLRSIQSDTGRAHNSLLKRISQQNDIYEKIKRDIIEDNKRTGVRPASRRPMSSSSSSSSSPPANGHGVNGAHAAATTNGQAQPPASGSSAKTKPAVHPKPQALHGNAIQPGHGRTASMASTPMDLVARFANLRGPQSSPGQDPRIKTYPIPTQKPAGRREMPGSPKLNINTDAAVSVLPKVPDAIYSPARGSVSGEAARLPSSTPRGLFSRTGSSVSVTTLTTTSQQPSSDYVPLVPKPATPGESGEPVKIPEGDGITAKQLYEAMKAKGSILLIDLRSREDFDEGHIMSSSIICIEPSILLRNNISSDEISESMVLSPNQEQALFDERDQYDLVVFYDRSSQRIPESPKDSDEQVVFSLHRALIHLNYARDLRRPPKILQGGLDAWVDLMGLGSLLSTSADSALVRQPRSGSAPQRKVPRHIVASLQPADVKVWQSTLEKETQQPAARPTFPRTGDEYLQSTAVSLKQQSMTFPPPAEERPRHGLEHNRMGSPGQLPAPPARPRAAVQRPSHSGLTHGDDDTQSYGESGVASMHRAVARPKKAAAEPLSWGVPKAYTGLNNPRNWCYANSTLQALLASPGFGRELADSEWKRKYKVPRKRDEKIEPPQLMIQMVSNLFHWMNTGTFQTMKAQTLMEYSRQLCKSSDEDSQFGGSAQQDAQEFMSFVMEQLHDETNPRRDRPGIVTQPGTQGRPLVEAAVEYWDRHAEFNQSIVDHYWRGVELSTVQCMECNTQTHTFSPFGFVPVPVSRGRDMTLPEALHHYTAGNKLDDFSCDHCKGPRNAMQSMSFARMPLLLCINFRRFSWDGTNVCKSNTAISWDFNDVDLTPYFVDPSQRGVDGGGDRAFTGPFRYECYAVIVHSGHQLNMGHYFAYVRDWSSRDPSAWYRCDDSRVTKVRIGSGDSGDLQKEVFRSDTDRVPYLVFFRRKGA